jgi:hypothetical protein
VLLRGPHQHLRSTPLHLSQSCRQHALAPSAQLLLDNLLLRAVPAVLFGIPFYFLMVRGVGPRSNNTRPSSVSGMA